MSGYRLFIGQLVRDVRRREVEDAFSKFGEIVRIDIKNGFGFVEYEHSRDAEEAIRKMDGEDFLGRRIIVEYARGRKRERERERGGGRGSGNNGPERSDYRVIVEGLGRSTSWQDLKDAFRSSGDILFTDVRRDRYDEYYGIVEFRYKDDIDHAIRKMDGAEVNGHKIRVKEDRRKGRSRSPDRKKRRSRSREKRSGSRKRRSGSRDRKSPSKEKERDRRSPSKERDRERRSPSKEKERERRSGSKDRRSPSKEKERRSPSKERRSPSKERERSEDKERRSPSKEKERERRSGSRDSKPREGSEDRKRSRSTERKAEEEDKERETEKENQDN